MSNTEASAGGLLGALREAFNFGQKKPAETPAAVATETPTPADFIPTPEPTATMTSPGPTVTEIPVPTAEFSAPSDSELPDWLQGGKEKAEVEAPLPETSASVQTLAPEAPSALQAIEAPAVPPEAKAESDPFATSREFNGYMELIRQTQEVLASGAALNLKDQRTALIAVAKANSLLPKLPPEVFKSVLLMRAVASGNPKFGRDDFQLEMLGAMDIIKGKK